jgi:hypothetical protein
VKRIARQHRQRILARKSKGLQARPPNVLVEMLDALSDVFGEIPTRDATGLTKGLEQMHFPDP